MYLIYISLLPPSLDSRFQNQLSATHLTFYNQKNKKMPYIGCGPCPVASTPGFQPKPFILGEGKNTQTMHVLLGCPRKYFNIYSQMDINGVSWGYNPLILTFSKLPTGHPGVTPFRHPSPLRCADLKPFRRGMVEATRWCPYDLHKWSYKWYITYNNL